MTLVEEHDNMSRLKCFCEKLEDLLPKSNSGHCVAQECEVLGSFGIAVVIGPLAL